MPEAMNEKPIWRLRAGLTEPGLRTCRMEPIVHPSRILHQCRKLVPGAQFTNRRIRTLLTSPIVIHVNTTDEPP
jgi:hypothetical protein